ncbi:hypothetical protein [Aliarcobacter butzleri]|uniref:hypothetical protein n=1 Tax=Aliarcobacter butzleri TaxID=28197 RepID=UPI0021B3BFC4|nr:hypothetical protein [Aliarcobacter butzleri]MCT7536432.1 hypothetical protein [Aliarcobacter butzleri]MCT7623372.1 hypothetical protein [Aliarcobacter butzleri]
MNLYTIAELSKKVKYSINTLYKKKKFMILGLHYYQLDKGKILFSDEAINFFLNSKIENLKGNTIQKKKQSVSLSEYLS